MTEHDQHDRDGFDRDDELRARLRAADPAAHLAPADPAVTARLLETAMTHTVENPSTSTTRVTRRGRLVLVAGAAAAVAAIGFGAAQLGGGEDGDRPVADPSTGSSADTGTGGDQVTTLTAVPQAGARCAVPTPEFLAAQPFAFEGTVTAVEGGTITLEVEEVFAGAATDTVAVEAPPQAIQDQLIGVDFQVGETYLVSAADGQVSACGFSGAASPELDRLYDQAFGSK
ncbi:hypothetical protein [Nocardioides sp. SYSU D00038]|uniref:hypothetical protein n=1 Tax=Nocardioides sp. SYSU D00038 TaxID=2812554 RepID=UPI001967D164|nr:hypothetical protein [Nocardioides sp. SYSU D00038]